jgi:pyrimidine-nucleoside phosphorylase
VILAGEMAAAGGGITYLDAIQRAQENLDNGKAYAKFEAWMEAQGGDLLAFQKRVRARYQVEVTAPEEGFVQTIHALRLGRLAMALGAGRSNLDAKIDPVAGIVLQVAAGQAVARHDVLGVLHCSRPVSLGEERELLAGIEIGQEEVLSKPLVLGRWG